MRSIEEGKPDYEKEFPKVFSEEEFRELPLRRKWDHAIELKEGHQPPRGKCYLLAAKKRTPCESLLQKTNKTEELEKARHLAQVPSS
jgi:hypothetical protein